MTTTSQTETTPIYEQTKAETLIDPFSKLPLPGSTAAAKRPTRKKKLP